MDVKQSKSWEEFHCVLEEIAKAKISIRIDDIVTDDNSDDFDYKMIFSASSNMKEDNKLQSIMGYQKEGFYRGKDLHKLDLVVKLFTLLRDAYS